MNFPELSEIIVASSTSERVGALDTRNEHAAELILKEAARKEMKIMFEVEISWHESSIRTLK